MMPMFKKYFLDKDGVPTRRMNSPAGEGHYDVAREIIGDLAPGHSFYDAMYRLKFIRVVETDTEILVDAPHNPTNRQTRALKDIAANVPPGMPKKEIKINPKSFLESRDPRDKMVGRAGLEPAKS